MPQYIMTYLGGNPPASPEEGKEHFAKYNDWLKNLGDAAISPANPFKNSHTIQADGSIKTGSSVSMSGYTIIEAASIEEAIAHAKTCPFLETGGRMEVAELIKM